MERDNHKDFFISYTSADRTWAEWIAWQLEQAGYSTVIQDWDFRPGCNFVQEMDTATKAAERTIAILSPDYFNSGFTPSEWSAAFQRDPRSERRLLIPVRVQECDVKGLLGEIVYIDLVGQDDQIAHTLLLAGVRNERAKPTAPPAFPAVPSILSELPACPGAFPPIWNVLYPRNLFFTGHEDLLQRLSMAFKTNSTTALTQPQAFSGLGGIGKTQLAVEYAYRYRSEYQAVFWVRADTRENLISDFVAIAGLLNLSEKDDQEQLRAVNAVKEWLRAHREWLLILDNADDLLIVREFLPITLGGHLLLTTRAQALGGIAHRIEVEQMKPGVGALFLLRRANLLPTDVPLEEASPMDREVALEIAREMDGLPLALDQAGAYIEETGCNISDYLDRYRTQRHKLLQRRGRLVIDHPESVTATFLLSFEKVKQINFGAAQLLKFYAFLSPEAIPDEFLTDGAAEFEPELQALADDPIAFDEAMETLRSFSLIRRIPSAKIIFIHRLVQAVLRNTMNSGEQRQWAERVIRILNRVFPDPMEIEVWPICRRYLPHAQVCALLIHQWSLKLGEASQLLNEIGYYLQHAHGLYSEAEKLYTFALSNGIQMFGPEHPRVIPFLNNLAEIYRIQGRYLHAEPLYQQSHALRVKQFGHNHLSVASSLNNLATFYGDQGKYTEAEIYHQQALAIRKKILGPLHSDIAVSLNNLAEIYRIQEKYNQAEVFYQEALKISKQVLGDKHLHVATILNNLAVLYSAQNKYYQAEPLCKESLSITEQTLGSDHPDTAVNFIGLAEIYIHQTKYDQAEELIQKSLLIFKQTLGPNHFYIAQCLHNLGWLYYVQSKYPEAEVAYQQSMALYQQYPELEYPHLAESFQKMADLYKAQERYAEAEPLYEKALMYVEHALGHEHPRVGRGYHNLGWLCHQQKKYDKAESLYHHALSILVQSVGAKHSDVVMCLSHLAGLYRDQGKYVQAEPLYLQALDICEQLSGSEHPETARLMNNLALLFSKQGEYMKAEPLYRRALSICEQILGSEHVDVGKCLYNLAELYFDQGKYQEAEPLYQRVLHIREKTLGQGHPKVTKVLLIYSALLRKMGRVKDAAKLETQLIGSSSELIPNMVAFRVAEQVCGSQAALPANAGDL